ncbi:MAG: hypothetical protein R3F60_05280 [bacterium]
MLNDNVNQLGDEIKAAALKCEAAMQAHAEADTAWEALQGR